jgi:tRNA-splicing ligase RtcB
MPAWCAYRDAARQEHVAKEAATAAAGIAAMRPQEASFQNSPLKVFGQHDENTLAQMRNCMAVGNVVSGVICADGHLGYAQPVGGVIAYEKQISISGVGFDIGCGNMAVRLDTKFSDIEHKVMPIIRDVSRSSRSGLAARMRSASSTSYSMMPTLGASPTWASIALRPLPSSGRSGRATTTLT